MRRKERKKKGYQDGRMGRWENRMGGGEEGEERGKKVMVERHRINIDERGYKDTS